jgi:hypothetical protein
MSPEAKDDLVTFCKNMCLEDARKPMRFRLFDFDGHVTTRPPSAGKAIILKAQCDVIAAVSGDPWPNVQLWTIKN